MKRKLSFIIIVLLHTQVLIAQKDSAQKVDLSHVEDYDALFSELEILLDSLTNPRSFTIVNVSAGNRIYNYKSASSSFLTSDKTLAVMPSFGYFNKTGLGINAAASVIRENNRLNTYQYSVTASYDYLKNRNLLTGVSFSRYFTKDSLNFYTSPLQNEVFAYFSYRRFWLKPSISASYGWGSRTELQKREEKIKSLIKRLNGNRGRGNSNGGSVIVEEINSIESVRDLNVSLNLRHDFYWLDVLVSNDLVRFTPQVSFTAGTQNFGFNQNVSYNAKNPIGKGNFLFNSENYSLDEKTKFQPLSLTAFLKSEFSMGKFFFQPQLILDYYLPAYTQNFTTTFVVNSGLIF